MAPLLGTHLCFVRHLQGLGSPPLQEATNGSGSLGAHLVQFVSEFVFLSHDMLVHPAQDGPESQSPCARAINRNSIAKNSSASCRNRGRNLRGQAKRLLHQCALHILLGHQRRIRCEIFLYTRPARSFGGLAQIPRELCFEGGFVGSLDSLLDFAD